MSKSKNNFKNPDIVQKTQYKLWIAHNQQGISKGLPPKMTYYGFLSKKDGGLKSLLQLREKREGLYIKAELYDGTGKNKLQEWVGTKY